MKILLDLSMGTVDCSTLEQSVVLISTPTSEEKKNSLLQYNAITSDRSLPLIIIGMGRGLWYGLVLSKSVLLSSSLWVVS